jgi:enoyl-CoA hydratase/carnithine racemase
MRAARHRRGAFAPDRLPGHLRKPLIAAVNGAAAGLGLVQVVCCDIRFSTPEAKFTAAFSRRGLIAEYGISWMLPRIIGTANAMDVLLSSRIIRGEEALSMGLVNRVVDADSLLAETLDYAEELATHASPNSVTTIKGQVRRHLETDFATAVEESDALMHESFGWPDVKEGVESYIEKRPPRFAGLTPRSS